MVMISVCLCLDMLCPLVKRDQAFFHIQFFRAGQTFGAQQIHPGNIDPEKIICIKR